MTAVFVENSTELVMSDQKLSNNLWPVAAFEAGHRKSVTEKGEVTGFGGRFRKTRKPSVHAGFRAFALFGHRRPENPASKICDWFSLDAIGSPGLQSHIFSSVTYFILKYVTASTPNLSGLKPYQSHYHIFF